MLIRDTLHGDIELSQIEARVLDCPAVQRLRGIKQLGTAYLVYPGAVHSRFEHSLGTCATAHKIIDSVRRSGVAVDADTEAAIAVAALLHDITHVPFGHTLEDERRLFPRHDKGDRFDRLMAVGLADKLGEFGVRDAVAALLAPEGDPAAMPAPWAGEVVSSTIDADLLDYLGRDALYTGLAQTFDERVFRYFTVAEGHLVLDMSKHGMTRLDAWSEVVQLLRLRYFLTERVYYHHTKVVAGAMISKAVEVAWDGGELHESALLEHSDWSLLAHLGACSQESVASLAKKVESRNLYKRAYVLSGASLSFEERSSLVDRYHRSRAQRAEAETALAKAAGVGEADVIVYCPALTVMKEAAALAYTQRGIVSMNEIDVIGSHEIAALAERHADLWRLYVFAADAHIERVGNAAEELFGKPSEYRRRAHS